MPPRYIERLARRGAWLVCTALALAPNQSDAQSAATVRPLQYTRVVLSNGLVALFNEDHSAPVVGVGVSYHIGGKDERPGHTGLAHLCEHMLFEGSPNVPAGQFVAIITAIGGVSGGWAATSEDRTFYWETVPSAQLETALWLESDRMADPFGAMDSTRLDNSRLTIKNERLQRVESI